MVPWCWKQSIEIPVAKTNHPKVFNDFRAVALTSRVMMSFEKLILPRPACPFTVCLQVEGSKNHAKLHEYSHGPVINEIVDWCDDAVLQLNVQKTKNI